MRLREKECLLDKEAGGEELVVDPIRRSRRSCACAYSGIAALISYFY